MIGRLIQLFVGVTLCGIAVAAMVRANLGLGPWDVLHQGIATRLGLSLGTVVILVSALVMVFWIPLRQKPHVGTLINVVTIGLVANVGLANIPNAIDIGSRVALLVLGIVGTGVGSAIYLGAGLGAGSRDGLMTGISFRFGMPIYAVRTLLEVSVLSIGWMIGGQFGIGTIAFAFLTGPVVHAALPWCDHRNWNGLSFKLADCASS